MGGLPTKPDLLFNPVGKELDVEKTLGTYDEFGRQAHVRSSKDIFVCEREVKEESEDDIERAKDHVVPKTLVDEPQTNTSGGDWLDDRGNKGEKNLVSHLMQVRPSQ